MKPITVTYQKAFWIGSFLQHKIEIGYQLEEGQSVEQALDMAKKTVDEWNLANNSFSPVDSSSQVNDIKIEKDHTGNRVAALISDIYSCKELKVLESYRIMAKSSPELQAAYDQQFKKLSQ